MNTNRNTLKARALEEGLSPAKVRELVDMVPPSLSLGEALYTPLELLLERITMEEGENVRKLRELHDARMQGSKAGVALHLAEISDPIHVGPSVIEWHDPAERPITEGPFLCVIQLRSITLAVLHWHQEKGWVDPNGRKVAKAVTVKRWADLSAILHPRTVSRSWIFDDDDDDGDE